jgi:chorismate-pyruvate lyase
MNIKQQDAQIRLYFFQMLYIFLTLLVHHQEQSLMSCTLHLVYAGTIRLAVMWLKEVILITTQQPDVAAHTKCDVQLIKGCF